VRPVPFARDTEVNAPVLAVVLFLNKPTPLISCAFVTIYPIPPKVKGQALVIVPLLIILPPNASWQLEICLNSDPLLMVRLPVTCSPNDPVLKEVDAHRPDTLPPFTTKFRIGTTPLLFVSKQKPLILPDSALTPSPKRIVCVPLKHEVDADAVIRKLWVEVAAYEL